MKSEGKITLPAQIFEYLQGWGGPANRNQIADAVGVNYEAARKAISRMLAAGLLIAHEKKDHKDVGIYSLSPEARLAKSANGLLIVVMVGKEPKRRPKQEPEPKREPVKAEDEPKQEEKVKPGSRGKGTGAFKDDDNSMFEYQKGYQDGYNDAIGHSQKDAYQAGKRVVIEGLLKLLKVDARVLMA